LRKLLTGERIEEIRANALNFLEADYEWVKI